MACSKQGYSKGKAEQVRRLRLRSRGAPALYLRIYLCPTCHRYHLTHQKQQQ
jgi:hypothetical protein